MQMWFHGMNLDATTLAGISTISILGNFSKLTWRYRKFPLKNATLGIIFWLLAYFYILWVDASIILFRGFSWAASMLLSLILKEDFGLLESVSSVYLAEGFLPSGYSSP